MVSFVAEDDGVDDRLSLPAPPSLFPSSDSFGCCFDEFFRFAPFDVLDD